MKKIIFILVVITASFSFTPMVFAADENKTIVDYPVRVAFSKDFILTSNVSWHKIDNVFVVDFTQLDTSYSAYYTEEGVLKSISSNIEKEKLPAHVIMNLNKRYRQAEILKAIKVRSREEGISYVIYIATGHDKKIITADEDGRIERAKTIKNN